MPGRSTSQTCVADQLLENQLLASDPDMGIILEQLAAGANPLRRMSLSWSRAYPHPTPLVAVTDRHFPGHLQVLDRMLTELSAVSRPIPLPIKRQAMMSGLRQRSMPVWRLLASHGFDFLSIRLLGATDHPLPLVLSSRYGWLDGAQFVRSLQAQRDQDLLENQTAPVATRSTRSLRL